MRIEVCLLLSTILLCSSTFLSSQSHQPTHVNLQVKLRTKLEAMHEASSDPDELFSCAAQQEDETKAEVADAMEELAAEMEDTPPCEQKEKAAEYIQQQPPEVVAYILPLLDEPEVTEEVMEEVPVPAKPYFRPEKQEIVQVVDDEIIKIPVTHNIPPCSAPPEKPYIPLPEVDEVPPPPPPQAERLVFDPIEAPCEKEHRERLDNVLPDVKRLIDAMEESEDQGMEVYHQIETGVTVEEIIEILIHNGDEQVASMLLANLDREEGGELEETEEAGDDAVQDESTEEESVDQNDQEETEDESAQELNSDDEQEQSQEDTEEESEEEETEEEESSEDSSGELRYDEVNENSQEEDQENEQNQNEEAENQESSNDDNDETELAESESTEEPQVLQVSSFSPSEQITPIQPAVPEEQGEAAMEVAEMEAPPSTDQQLMQNIVSSAVADSQTDEKPMNFIKQKIAPIQ